MSAPPKDLADRLIRPECYGEFGIPHDSFRWLREHDPIHWTEPHGLRPFWAVTTHAELLEVESTPEVFSNAERGVVVNPLQGRVSIRSQFIARMRPLVSKSVRRRLLALRPKDAFRPIVQMDPPDHHVYRRVARDFFTPAGVATHHEMIASVSAEVFASTRQHTGEFDFVDVVGRRQPLLVLSRLLGLDEAQTAEVLFLTISHYEGSSDEESSVEERTRWIELIDAIVEDRRSRPCDDLASMLANATIDGAPIPPPELRGYFLILFTAGHDTTGHSLAGAIDAFIEHPSEFERLRADPSLIPTAVEEIVRWTAPVNYMKRTALRDYRLGGVDISKGDELVLFYGSACRDEAMFNEPDRFDIGRSTTRHMGFGWATHHCLGAHLARSSITAFLSELRTRVRTIERAGAPTFTPASFVTGHATLPVRFEWEANGSDDRE